MTKIVCDYNVVSRIAENIKNSVDNMNNTTNSYQSTISNDLTSWQGKAETSFVTGINNQVININNNISLVLAIAEHLKNAAEQIETLDEEFASITI